MISGYLSFLIVMKQDSYASGVIEIQDGQKPVQTGLFSFARHPMYQAVTVLYTFVPLVQCSYYALFPMIFIPILLVIRIRNEEKVLLKDLKGYEEYIKKVK